MRSALAAVVGLAAVGLAAYWALVLSEGVYLGPGVVRWLYDRAARRYDRIKNLDPQDDARCLARPLLTVLDRVAEPLVLDVATGTGRVPLALRSEGDFAGRVLGLDRSPAMLDEARRKLGRGDAALILGDAGRLPFAEGTFDAVTCLEALEFTASPRHVLGELIRVLKPGGVLLASHRVGLDALYFPGRGCGRGRLEARLSALGMQDVEAEPWQVYYDLVWARKAGDSLHDRPAPESRSAPESRL